MEAHDAGAAETLRNIERGGHHLLIIARRRIGQVLDELDNGRFHSAMNALDGARQALGPLVNAESNMAVAATSRLVLVTQLEPGMVLTGVGEITAVEISEDCGTQSCPGHVQVMIGEQPVVLDGSAEVYVEAS